MKEILQLLKNVENSLQSDILVPQFQPRLFESEMVLEFNLKTLQIQMLGLYNFGRDCSVFAFQ